MSAVAPETQVATHPKPDAGRTRALPKHWVALLVIALLVGLVFVAVAALPYFQGDVTKLARYHGKQGWLFLHIVPGIIALLLGPFQLWLGFTQPRHALHRQLGMLYLGAISVSSVAAYYLAFHTDVSFTFRFGLAGLATAWMVTSSMAIAAVKQRQFLQHQEWMIRSYVVTFAFVTFRIFTRFLAAFNVGTFLDQLNVASWFCWAVPLLICEALIQGRKFARRKV